MSDNQFISRSRGALLGLAAGDALGTTLEFKPRGTFEPISDMCGGGPFQLNAGQWTDDTSMALCLADSLIECSGHDPKDQMNRYLQWWNQGYNSSTGDCFDIGCTVAAALQTYESTGNPNAGTTHPNSAGNGSIMRLAPVAIYFSPTKGYSFEEMMDKAALSSITTHGEASCIEACKILAYILGTIFTGIEDKKELIDKIATNFPINSSDAPIIKKLRQAVAISCSDTTTQTQIKGSGYVVDSLQAAIWCFFNSDNFEKGALLAANLGDDADTTCAVYGQIAGAYYGASSIPIHWLKKLFWLEHINGLAVTLANANSNIG